MFNVWVMARHGRRSTVSQTRRANMHMRARDQVGSIRHLLCVGVLALGWIGTAQAQAHLDALIDRARMPPPGRVTRHCQGHYRGREQRQPPGPGRAVPGGPPVVLPNAQSVRPGPARPAPVAHGQRRHWPHADQLARVGPTVGGATGCIVGAWPQCAYRVPDSAR